MMNDDKYKNDNKFTSKFCFEVNYYHKKIELNVLSNSFNTYVAYHIDHNLYHVYKHKYNLNVNFNLNKSIFCNTFLDLSTNKTDGLDEQNKFCSIYTQYKDIISYDFTYTIMYEKVIKSTSFLENKLDIYGLRLNKFKDNFLYCICNRQFVDKNTFKIIIRSSSFCVYTPDCYNYLQKLYKKYKTTGIKKENTEDAISSIFSDSLTPQQIQNGFML